MSLTGTPLFNQLSVPARESMMGAFSLKAIGGVTAKVIQVSNGAAVKDFYADRIGSLLDAPVTGQTLRRWLGGVTGNVVTWYDQSGRGNHMSCSSEANRPTVVLDAVDGNFVDFRPDKFLNVSANTANGPVPWSNARPYTVIWHHGTIDAGGLGAVCYSAYDGSVSFGMNEGVYKNIFDGQATVIGSAYAPGDTVTFKWDGADVTSYTNSVTSGTQATSWNQTGSTGQYIGLEFLGSLYSVLMFESALSDADRTLIENVPPPQTPSQVTNFVGGNETTTSIDLTWDASPLATGYIVICVNTGVPQTIEGATGATFIDLSHDTEYTFTITPANLAGNGPTTTSAPIRTMKYINYIPYSGSAVDVTLPPGAYTFEMAGGSGPDGFTHFFPYNPALGYWKRMTFKYTLTAATLVSFIVGGPSPDNNVGGGGGSYIYAHGAINDWLFVVGGGGVNFNNSTSSGSGGNLEMPEEAGDGAGGASNGPAGGGGAGISAIGNGADGVSCGGGQGFTPDSFTVNGGNGGTGQYPGAFGGGGGGADIPGESFGRKYVGGGGGYTGGSAYISQAAYNNETGELSIKTFSTSGTSYKITGSELDSYTYGNGPGQGYIIINP